MKRGIKSAIVLFAVAASSGCATSPSSQPSPGVEQISFDPSPGPFCGRCETTKLVATANGQLFIEVGYWGGQYRSWTSERSVRQITPAQFAEFKRRLEPYRPATDVGSGDERCANYITDQGAAHVEWLHGDERRARRFDFGCLDDRVMNESVRTAPGAFGR